MRRPHPSVPSCEQLHHSDFNQIQLFLYKTWREWTVRKQAQCVLLHVRAQMNFCLYFQYLPDMDDI